MKKQTCIDAWHPARPLRLSHESTSDGGLLRSGRRGPLGLRLLSVANSATMKEVRLCRVGDPPIRKAGGRGRTVTCVAFDYIAVIGRAYQNLGQVLNHSVTASDCLFRDDDYKLSFVEETNGLVTGHFLSCNRMCAVHTSADA